MSRLGKRDFWLALPALGWFSWFLMIPLGFVVVYSFASRGIYGGIVFRFTPDHYIRALDGIYIKIFLNSVRLAGVTAISCLLVGYPMAYVMATASKKWRTILLVLVVVPFWTNFVVRTYALKLLFSEQGPLNWAALSLRLIAEPFVFADTSFSLWLGMVTNYLPFMVLPLYVALEKFDFAYLEAGKDLGAGPFNLLIRVLIPLTQSGIVTGLVFVFTPALGEFVIPDLLGGARTMLMGNLITEQFLKARDWPFGASLSLLLIFVVMISWVVYLRASLGSESQKKDSWSM